MSQKTRTLIVMISAVIYLIFGILNSTLSLRFISFTEKDSDEIIVLSMSANTIGACRIYDEGEESDCGSREGFFPRFLVFEVFPLLFVIGLFGLALMAFLEAEGSPRQASRLAALRVSQQVGRILFAAIFLSALKEYFTVYHIIYAMKPKGHGAEALNVRFQWSLGLGFYMPFILSSMGLFASFLPLNKAAQWAGAAPTPGVIPPPPAPMAAPTPMVAPASGADPVCPKCNFRQSADARFCKNCGHPMRLECPACHFANDGDGRFCKNCGGPLQKQA